MLLDFRRNQPLPEDVLRELNAIAMEIRADFNAAIDSLSRALRHKPGWLMSGPASRNTLASPLFEHCANLILLQRMAGRAAPPPSAIVTDSRAFAHMARVIFKDTPTDIRLDVPKRSLKRLIVSMLTDISLLLYQLRLFRAVTSLMPREDAPASPLVLIDTSIMPGFENNERLYPDLLEPLHAEEQQKVRFVPTAYRLTKDNTAEYVDTLRRSKRRFLLKQHYLKTGDILQSWLVLLASRLQAVPQTRFLGLDITALIREDLCSKTQNYGAFEGLLNIRFCRRLAASGVNVRTVICWFENQPQSRGWHLGFRQHFPDANIVGYQGFPPLPLYLCTCPSQGEFEVGVLPKKVVSICEAGKGVVNEFCPALEVQAGPALRYASVFKTVQPQPSRQGFAILIPLPTFLGMCIHMLEIARQMSKHMPGVHFFCKAHPGHTAEDLQIIFSGPPPSDLHRAAGGLEDSLAQCDAVLAGFSTSCIHSLALGKPVLQIMNPFGVELIPFPPGVDRRMYWECYTAQEAVAAVAAIRDRLAESPRYYAQLGAAVRRQFFTPPTRENRLQLLGLDDGRC